MLPPPPSTRYVSRRRVTPEGRPFSVHHVVDVVGREYAVKTPAAPTAPDDPRLGEIAWEAEVLERLCGVDGVVGSAGEPEDQPALVTRWIPGASLAARLAERSLSPGAAAELLLRLCRIVAGVHARGVVHRDLKPSNVIVAETGDPFLIDFGVAAYIGRAGDGGMEAPDGIGTLVYRAPEQDGPAAPAHPSADVYALGVILYEILTGRLPYEMEDGEDESALRERLLREDPVPPSTHQPTLPAEMERVVLRALRRDPEHRYRSTDDLETELLRAIAAGQTERAPVGRARRAGALTAGVTVAWLLLGYWLLGSG